MVPPMRLVVMILSMAAFVVSLRLLIVALPTTMWGFPLVAALVGWCAVLVDDLVIIAFLNSL